MGKKQIEEILSRLASLEARLGSDEHGPGLDAGFDEKRVVDLIVRLTTEQVARVVAEKIDEHRLDEKRLVDAIARTVTERVEQIAARMRRDWEQGAPEAEGSDADPNDDSDGRVAAPVARAAKRSMKRR